uniref:Rho guanine nucleotide exchange factor (GEF) 1 n=1 Tax=Sander lucioperca TaxID=283035 RepID=A0A8C9ZZV9_SANLU
MSIIGAEDEDFENDLNDVMEDQCAHFNNIDQLKERPTHLLVFMQHVILQFDPAPLLCYLHAELFKNLSAKETKKQFVEFYNTFLDKGAILRVVLPANVAYELDRTRPDLLHEDTQKRYVQEVQTTWVILELRCAVVTSLNQSHTKILHFPSFLSFEGPVSLPEGPGHSPTSPSPQLEEMEPRFLEFEHDPPNWRELAPPEALSSLSKKETKRQEVINELFATEHAHVRMLSVLQMIFSKPLEREGLLASPELAAIFPNLDEIIEMHYNFYENLKKLRLDDNFIVKSISTTVLNRFGGTEGEWFQKLTARFCSHQSWALDQIKSRQKKEPRFNSFILEAESKPQCRRLQLKDIIPIEMQRLTKYPLLLENIAKSTENSTEKDRIQQSAECCRKILNHVNEEVKVMENLLTLKDYQRRLDTSGLKPSNELYTEYKNIDLTQKKMLYEGSVTWRVTKEKAIEVQCVLLGDLLVLLQRQDDKMVLKCQSKSNIAVQEGKQMLSPIIKLDSVFLREVATDRKAFYVIFTWDSGAQIYELVAQSIGERKIWTDVIKSAVDDLKKSGAPMRLTLPPGSGGPPFSPSTYVSLCVCVCVCVCIYTFVERARHIHRLPKFTHLKISHFFCHFLSVRLTAPLSPTENGGLKSSGETAALYVLNT